MSYLEKPCLKIKQPIGTFYVSVLSYSELLSIAGADVRKLVSGTIDEYLGIQRKVDPGRIKEIAKYVRTEDATFPTSVILAIKSLDEDGIENGNFEEKDNVLKILQVEHVASILDGQHRLEGIRKAIELRQLDGDFDLNVTIFVNADIDSQAQIFSVINKAQTKVNKSLVYDLYEYAKHRSPQKTCHDIVRELNRNDTSPFHKKVKILGSESDSNVETIAQATLVELIMKFISSDPMNDRNELRKLFSSLSKPNESERKKLIFRELFIDEKDSEIAHIVGVYFNTVRHYWPNSWNIKSQGNILNKSTGIVALMKFLKTLYNEFVGIPGKRTFKDYCMEQFGVISSKYPDNHFTRDNYPPGATGQSQFLRELESSR